MTQINGAGREDLDSAGRFRCLLTAVGSGSKIGNSYQRAALTHSLTVFVEVVVGHVYFAIQENKRDGCSIVKPVSETVAHMSTRQPLVSPSYAHIHSV